MKQCLPIELGPRILESVRSTSPPTLFRPLSRTLFVTYLYRSPRGRVLLKIQKWFRQTCLHHRYVCIDKVIMCNLHAPQTRPSIWIDLTAFSISFMSVSSPQLFTSSTILDLAMTTGFFDFFSAYAFNLSSLTFAASASSSSSEPNKSKSSSSSFAFAVDEVGALAVLKMAGVFFSPGSDLKSYDFIWLYQRSTWGFDDVGAFPNASSTATSAWVGCHLTGVNSSVWYVILY